MGQLSCRAGRAAPRGVRGVSPLGLLSTLGGRRCTVIHKTGLFHRCSGVIQQVKPVVQGNQVPVEAT